jgi:hypothetical protein
MNLIMLDIPEDTDQLALWLERQIVGLQLRQLVVELESILPGERSATSLSEICGQSLPAVLETGLSALGDSQLHGLLRQPQSLLELQDAVLINEGSYWRQISRSIEHDQLVEGGWERIRASIVDSPASPAQPSTGIPGDQRRHSRVRYRWFAAAAAIAATLMLAIYVHQPSPPSTGWGWNRPGALSSNLPPRDYLNNLADSAQEWFKKTPQTSTELDLRLRQFRKGCEVLINAPHAQLTPEDRKLLVDNCKKWANKIDQHLADLASGRKSVAQVKDDAKVTVEALIHALRDQSRAA